MERTAAAGDTDNYYTAAVIRVIERR